ncbi:MAG: glycosyltransferase family 4 protein [Actinomycetota bacterium]|nr:glycosyltransferase family 4 protein [Actinomycetota bacterium]
MKFLHTVQHYDPFVGGSEEVVKQISERLVRRGHDVTIATAIDARRTSNMINGVNIKEFILAGNIVNGIKGGPSEAKRFVEFVRDSDFDIMLNYAAQIWNSDLLFSHLSEIKYAKIFAPCGYSALYDRQYKEYFSELPKHLNEYDRIVYHSDFYRDKEFGDRHKISNYTIIPNGAGAEEFAQDSLVDFKSKYQIPNKHLIICVSNHYFDKGHALILEAFDRSRISDTSLAVIGNEPTGGCQELCKDAARAINKHSGGKKTVHVISNISRSDVVAAYKQADLFVFGSKIECFPLVLIEAMASQTAFISTDSGCAKHFPGGVVVHDQPSTNPLITRLGNKLSGQKEHAVDSGAFAKTITELILDEGRRKQLATEGYNAWQKQYNWDRVVDRYESLYIDLARKKQDSTSRVKR